MLDVPIRRRKRSSYRVTTALVGLELCAGKLACTVLRGLGAGNRPWLLDFLSQQVTLTEQRNEALAKTLIFNKVTKNLKILRTSLKKSDERQYWERKTLQSLAKCGNWKKNCQPSLTVNLRLLKNSENNAVVLVPRKTVRSYGLT